MGIRCIDVTTPDKHNVLFQYPAAIHSRIHPFPISISRNIRVNRVGLLYLRDQASMSQFVLDHVSLKTCEIGET